LFEKTPKGSVKLEGETQITVDVCTCSRPTRHGELEQWWSQQAETENLQRDDSKQANTRRYFKFL